MVKKTANGTWIADCTLGYTANAKQIRKRKFGFKTKKEAQEWEQEQKQKAKNGYSVTADKIIFANFLDDWFNNYKKPSLSQNTIANYNNRINKYIKPSLGNLKLNQITNFTIQNFYNNLVNNYNLKAETIKKIMEVLSGVFRYAKRNKLIADMPTEIEKQPFKKENKKADKVWNIKQINTFLQEVKDTYLYFPIFLEINIGARPGELCGLQWKDVDFVKKTIKIQKQALTNKETRKVYLSSVLKTNTSSREISVSTKLLKVLEKEKQIRNAEEEDFLITELDDVNFIAKKPCKSNNINENFTRKIKLLNKEKNLNLPEISLNGLRHTHATILAEQNLNIKAVSRRLGHKDIQTTLTYYTHVTQKMEDEICKTLDNLF